MGGVAGHLMHLYDNRGLTFNGVKKILSMASHGELVGTEKTDGYNIYLGYVDGDARAARNKGDMSSGGMTLGNLEAREFKGGDRVKQVYVDAFRAYKKSLEVLTPPELAGIFGEDGSIFYNAEIQGPEASNVINYDLDTVSIHHSGHKRYNAETNQLEVIDTQENSKVLDGVIDRFEERLEGEPFRVRRTAYLQLNRLESDHDLNIALERLKKAGFSGNMTIEEFLSEYVHASVSRRLPHITDDLKEKIVGRILKIEGALGLPQITKGLPADAKLAIKNVVNDGKKYLAEAIWPIESAIHDFSVELLRGLQSSYILDNTKELARLRSEVATAITNIQQYTGPFQAQAHEVLYKQLQKIKNHDNIDTVVEGFVFEHDGQIYKFTGNFAPVNQLLGLFKYGRGNVPPLQTDKVGEQPMQEETREDLEAQTIALLPGKYKPPHRGHLDMAKHYSEVADKVIVLISPIEVQLNSENTPSISAGLSAKIWDIYLSTVELGNVEVEISEYNSPVQASMEYGNKPEMHGKNIILGASTKDGDASQRFAGDIQKYAPDVRVLDPMQFAFPPMGEVLSASDFRTAIENEDVLAMEKYIPKEVKHAGRMVDVLDLLSVDAAYFHPRDNRSNASFDLSLNEEDSGVDDIFKLIEQEIEESENFFHMRDDGQTGEWSSGKSKENKKDDLEKEEEEDTGEKRVKNKVDQVVTVTKKVKSKVDQEVVSEVIEEIFKIFEIENETDDVIEEEDLEEISAMGVAGGGAVEGGAVTDDDDETKSKKSIIREKDQLVGEILDYLSK